MKEYPANKKTFWPSEFFLNYLPRSMKCQGGGGGKDFNGDFINPAKKIPFRKPEGYLVFEPGYQ
jgi:hypothetical protein